MYGIRNTVMRLAVLLVVGLGTLAPPGSAAPHKPIILFIVVDDLRPELGAYGRAHVKTPRIDELASRGLVFERAYAQQAVCLPSRTSVLTGLRPDSTRVYDDSTFFRTNVPDVVTLPQYFKQHGYRTVGLGKVYHFGFNDRRSWSRSVEHAGGSTYQLRENQAVVARKRAAARKRGLADVALILASKGPVAEAVDVPDDAYADGKITDMAIAELREHSDEPLFLAVGYLKPHLPFVAPKRYWDLYDPATLPLAANPFPPRGVPQVALHRSEELRSYEGVPGAGPVGDVLARTLVHGYLACTSYVDAQIGRLLSEIERLGLREDTIVVLWGDHGWHLGENGLWTKRTNFEAATRAPLIIDAPGASTHGRKTPALVELVDLYPTLVDLVGLPLPEHLEGTSLAPLLEDPTRPWKRAAFSQYPRDGAMGRSIRTDRYRFTRWTRENGATVGIELYDHREDPAENANLARDRSRATLVETLTQRLERGWADALPPAREEPISPP